jgi:hypothetical protein
MVMTTINDGAVAAAKGMLRLHGTEEDALLARLAATARGVGERFCGRAFADADDWDAVPAPLAHGLVLLAVHLWENRHDDQAPPAAVTALWRPFRVVRL